jgi:hypothetical protein
MAATPPLNTFMTYKLLPLPSAALELELGLGRQLNTAENLPLPRPSTSCHRGTSKVTNPTSSRGLASRPKNI